MCGIYRGELPPPTPGCWLVSSSNHKWPYNIGNWGWPVGIFSPFFTLLLRAEKKKTPLITGDGAHLVSVSSNPTPYFFSQVDHP